ncbi:MAG TPA: SUMF1/EgtB/PvdO family nonheme iron enzyme [Phycisphaerae bacterium]|nr:SUMF1/EgtB/PvdO family nonheme iron enzyme [Phycisphaerae bacterium]
MAPHAIACFALVAAATMPDGDVVVAVAPCVVGPNIDDDVGGVVTDLAVAALRNRPSIRILDRSLTAQVVREQDLALTSRATAVLPARFGDLGARQVLFIELLKLPSGLMLNCSLVDVATGEVLESAVHQEPSERALLTECGGWVTALWDKSVAASWQAGSVSANPVLQDMWDSLDQAEARRLLGPDVDRAESVYRQYVQYVDKNMAKEAERLSRLASVYLTDCLSLLQRAQHPPEGMVYVPSGWVVLPVLGGETRRFWLDGFFIDQCEYTRGQYARLPQADDASLATLSGADGHPTDLPLTGVTWYEAEAVAASRGMRLPTYPQWVRAVRGERHQKYPWGNVWRAENCSFARDPRHAAPESVRTYDGGASSFGVLDGVGSVFEWLATWHDLDYWDKAPARNPPGPREGSARLAVGGSYRSGPEGCTCTSMQQLTPGTRKDDVGFRCVLPLKGKSARDGSP